MPQTLKLTQVVSGCVLQTNSLRIAKKTKKKAHLLLSLFQPISSSLNAALKKNSKKFLLKKALPARSSIAKTKLMIVGFIYKKTGLLKYKVNPPNNEIIKPPTSGIYGIFLSKRYITPTAIIVDIINGGIALLKSFPLL